MRYVGNPHEGFLEGIFFVDFRFLTFSTENNANSTPNHRPVHFCIHIEPGTLGDCVMHGGKSDSTVAEYKHYPHK